jgi:hypothetical protein
VKHSSIKKAYNKRWRQDNPDKIREGGRRWRRANPDKVKKNKRRYRQGHSEQLRAYSKKWRKDHPCNVRKNSLKQRYNITIEEFEKLFRKQHGKCAICRIKQARGLRLCVDHCHVSKKTRGLLCRQCNAMLGSVHDSITILKAAIRYLQRNNK